MGWQERTDHLLQAMVEGLGAGETGISFLHVSKDMFDTILSDTEVKGEAPIIGDLV